MRYLILGALGMFGVFCLGYWLGLEAVAWWAG